MSWYHWLHPGRTTWPTRDGWWCLGAAVALGFAAMNTGNNLLYLLTSLLFGLIIVSGILAEQSMRRLRLAALVPDELYAGRPVLLGARIVNRKRWRTSYSLTLEVPPDGGRRFWVPRIEAGGEHVVTWEATLPARGRRRLPGVRVTTRFPFGLFAKSSRLLLDDEVIVFPTVEPLAPHHRALLGGGGSFATRRRGRGHDLYNLRDYRAGDDPRLIHWKSSAKTGTLVVRELEADTTTDTRIVLDDRGGGHPARLERGLSDAASLAAHLLRAGSAVELVGPGVVVPLGRGRGQVRRILTALALYDAPARAQQGMGWSGPARPVASGQCGRAREEPVSRDVGGVVERGRPASPPAPSRARVRVITVALG